MAEAQILTLPHEKEHVARIWKAFWALTVLTILELSCGLWIYFLQKGTPSDGLILFIKICIIIMTIGKAYYIISIFMHLGDEHRNMILLIALPALLFIWFITAFLCDGVSYGTMRNTDAHTRKYQKVEIRHQPLNIPKGAEKMYELK